MAWLIALIGPWFTHNVSRLVGILVVGAVLIGGPMLIYHGGYNKGYNQARKDYPQTVITGGTTNISSGKEAFFIFLKLGKFKLFQI